MNKCQYLFKNGTLCGTNSYNAIYCEGHTVIVLQDRIADLESALAAERVQVNKFALALEYYTNSTYYTEESQDMGEFVDDGEVARNALADYHKAREAK